MNPLLLLLFGGGIVAAGGIAIYEGTKKTTAATPANNTAAAQAVRNSLTWQLITTAITVPAGAPVALGVANVTPQQVPTLVAMQAAFTNPVAAGPGLPIPPGFPPDTLGNAAYRLIGYAKVGGPITPAAGISFWVKMPTQVGTYV
jgi:hypothetical protein